MLKFFIIIVWSIVLINLSTAVNAQTQHFTFTANTGNNATIALPINANPSLNGEPLSVGDEIGVFTPDSLCVGAVVWNNSSVAIFVWGDNPQTPGIKDGILPGEEMYFRVWKQSENLEISDVTVTYDTSSQYNGSGLYYPDAMYVLLSLEAFTRVSHTITTSPSGLNIVVDGDTLISPQTFSWVTGSNHTIGVISPQGNIQTQYVFSNWSDGGAITHTITASATPTTYTAAFTTEHYLTMIAGTGGTVTPESGWRTAGSTVQIQATPNTGYSFGSWTGTGNGSFTGTNSSADITMNGPITQSASFTLNPQAYTITTSPVGLSITVDGTTHTSPQTFNWLPGSEHTIGTTSPQGNIQTQYVFSNWSDGGAITHTITAPATPTTYTAAFTTEHYLTMIAGTGGTVTPESGWRTAGSIVQIQATPNTGYSFGSWTGTGNGSYTGTNSSADITMNGPITQSASFFMETITAPSDLEANAFSQTKINLSWSDNSNNEDGFEIERSLPPSTTWSGIGSVAAGVTAFQDTGLTTLTNYCYRVRAYNSFGYSEPSNTDCATTNFSLSVFIEDGWNMVSVPGLHPVDQGVSTWWIDRNPAANVFKFDGGYQSVTNTTPGEGYWMLHLGNRTYNTGDEWPDVGIKVATHTPIPASTGWNLIGGFEKEVSTSGITTIPAGLQQGSVFKYSASGGYDIASQLIPGYGYWIRLAGAGQIIIPDVLEKNNPDNSYFMNDWGRIIITDNAGRSYTLFAVTGDTDLSLYELPPLPPAGMFDIRFISERFAEDINITPKTLQMNGVEYPVKIRVENFNAKLTDETGKIIISYLKQGDEVVISNPAISKLVLSNEMIPDQFVLYQNYPNPFNPSTIISYALPEAGRVILKVYNLLGEEVATLVDEAQEKGFYETSFDASGLASGVYLYRIISGKFNAVKKMILNK